MKVLLDECVDWRLARDIVGHDIKTARQMGWATIKNGELLALAAEHFDVFVTDGSKPDFSAEACFALDCRHRASSKNEPACRSQAAGTKAFGGNRVCPARRREIH